MTGLSNYTVLDIQLNSGTSDSDSINETALPQVFSFGISGSAQRNRLPAGTNPAGSHSNRIERIEEEKFTPPRWQAVLPPGLCRSQPSLERVR